MSKIICGECGSTHVEYAFTVFIDANSVEDSRIDTHLLLDSIQIRDDDHHWCSSCEKHGTLIESEESV